MIEKNNATCSICGKPYHKCLSCRDAMKLQPWKMYTDTSSCFQVFQVVKGYNTGVYTKEEFKSKLKNIDLTDLENYKDNIKDLIKNTLKEDKVVEVELPIIDEVVTNEVVIEKPVYSRKRNYRANNEVEKTE